MIRVQKVRLYPNAKQEAALLRYLRNTREVYNLALELRLRAYEETGKGLSLAAQTKWLTMQRRLKSDWAAVPYSYQRETLGRLDRAYASFFRQVKNGEKPGYPKFKSWTRWNSLEELRDFSYVRGKKIHVPGIGLTKARNIQSFNGSTKSIRLMHKAGMWYAHIVVDSHCLAPEKRAVKSAVGIDVGITTFATLSDGATIEKPRNLTPLLPILAKKQRRLARKQPGSKNWEKARLSLWKTHLDISNAREDFLHQSSRMIINKYDLVAIEGLDVEGLLCKPTNHRALNRGIADAAWGAFSRMLDYKAEESGKQVVRVNPRGTSQECSRCGMVVRKELHERLHTCSCGLAINRDLNASINVLQRAVGAGLPVEGRTSGPAKQEVVHGDNSLQ